MKSNNRVSATAPLIFDDMTILEQNVCNAIIAMAKKDDPDYWTRLEHQYAGMAMQGILANSAFNDSSVADIAITSIKVATSLIKRLKEERK